MYKENRKIEYIKNKRIKKGSQVHHFSVPITTPYIILELESGQLCWVNLPSFQLETGDNGEGQPSQYWLHSRSFFYSNSWKNYSCPALPKGKYCATRFPPLVVLNTPKSWTCLPKISKNTCIRESQPNTNCLGLFYKNKQHRMTNFMT